MTGLCWDALEQSLLLWVIDICRLPVKYDCSIVDTQGSHRWSWWAPRGCLLNEWMKEKACELFYLFLLLRMYFWSSLRFTAKTEGTVRRLRMFPCRPHIPSSPTNISFPRQSRVSLTVDEPALAHDSHPKPWFASGFILRERKFLACFFLPLWRLICAEFGFHVSGTETISLNNWPWLVFLKWKSWHAQTLKWLLQMSENAVACS